MKLILMKLNRIKINFARMRAREILNYCGISYASEIDLTDILYARGIDIILSKEIDGSEARISFKEGRSVVSINSKINSINKYNFVLAHELAHYELHQDILKAIHIDNSNSINSWFSGGQHEIEANCFAAELLMPKKSFQIEVQNKPLSLNEIKRLSNLFKCSLTAVCLQYLNYGTTPFCIICSENGKVKWSKTTEDFKLKYIPISMPVSPNSVSGEYYFQNKFYEFREEITASVWFSNDYNFENFKNMILYEQCVRLSKNSILSLIYGD